MASAHGLRATTWAAQLLGRDPAAPAVVTPDGTWTTAELLARAATATRWLDAHGAAPGAPVAALVWSAPDALALLVAGAVWGRPVAPLGPLLTEAEVLACLDGLGASVLVADPSCQPLASAVADRAGLRLLELPGFEPDPAPRLPQRGPAPDDVAAVLHTSGTSGLPKRVPLRHGPLAARTRVNGALLALGPGDRYVTAKGVHHIGGLGLVLVALGAGAAVIPFRRYTPQAWRGLVPLAPTHGSVVPTMIEMLLESGGLGLPSLRVLQYGGAPIHPATLARLLAEEPALDVVAIYGQTEGSPLACLQATEHRAAVAGRHDLLEAAGRAAPGVELRVEGADDDGVGEIWARAEHVLRPGPDGWLRTGDLGRIDDEGYVRLVGRMGDMIVRGGENVHPVEVERVLLTHPGVRDVAVAAVPDRRLGETVGAWVVPVDPVPALDPGDLARHTRERLAGFKVPAVWTFCDELPRNANGKVVRRLLVTGSRDRDQPRERGGTPSVSS